MAGRKSKREENVGQKQSDIRPIADLILTYSKHIRNYSTCEIGPIANL